MFNWFKKKPERPRWRIVQRPYDYSIQEHIYVGDDGWDWVEHSAGYKTEDSALSALEIIRNPIIIYV